MPTALELTSPAKINLWLRVLGRREDGFHEVSTRLCRTSLCDRMSVERLDDPSIRELTCSDPLVPLDGSNLVWKALDAFEKGGGAVCGWRLHLNKVIPAGAGLGGGSSNAATALRAFNELTGGVLSAGHLLDAAGKVGSDIPCFLMDSPVADGSGRGEKVVPVHFPWALPLVMIKPPFPVPTPWAYGRWLESKERESVRYSVQSMPWGEMVNDLERPVFEKYLLLPVIKMWLLDQAETRAALMSGSGATVFAIAGSSGEATELAIKAREQFGDSMWIETAETLSSGAS